MIWVSLNSQFLTLRSKLLLQLNGGIGQSRVALTARKSSASETSIVPSKPAVWT